jgi:calpain-7
VEQFTHNNSAGDYTVVMSSYAPGMIGPYQLDIESMERFELETIPQEGAGLYSKVVLGEWSVTFSFFLPAALF